MSDMREQRSKYRAHRSRAERRGIGFKLTFEQWWELWEPHYDKMGREKGCMCMCRTLDKGAYEVGNVRIDYVESNGHERVVSRIAKKGPKWRDGHATTTSSGYFPRSSDCYRNPMRILEEMEEEDIDSWPIYG